MSIATVPATNVSRSTGKVKRLVDGNTEDVFLPTSRTFTAEFSEVRSALVGIVGLRRPNRCVPLHGGFESSEEKSAWDAASDESWGSIDAE